MSERWRVALVDSGLDAGFVDAEHAAFELRGDVVERCAPRPAATAHGRRIATVLAGARDIQLLSAQVFFANAVATPAAVAGAIDWAVERGAHLVHLSLGLAADRAVLRDAIARAIAAGRLVIAATPARGVESFPAAYAGVIRGTGDARCSPDEIAVLGPRTFGGCPRHAAPEQSGVPRAGGAAAAAYGGAGASIGAAHVTRALLRALPPGTRAVEACEALAAAACYHGPERRACPDGDARA